MVGLISMIIMILRAGKVTHFIHKIFYIMRYALHIRFRILYKMCAMTKGTCVFFFKFK